MSRFVDVNNIHVLVKAAVKLFSVRENNLCPSNGKCYAQINRIAID